MPDTEYPPPTNAMVRQLYGSAFRCAHPECNRPLYKVSEDGDLVLNSRVAHIHARRKGGPRWLGMDPEANRAFENLLLLCIEHSYEIDEVPGRFPADMLREWKASQIAEYKRLQRSWPINEDDATDVLVASESYDALHAPSIIELVRRVEALRLIAERTRSGPRSWSHKWQQTRERTQRDFIAWDQDGNRVYAEPSEMEVRPIRVGIQSSLDAALDEVRPAAEATQIELAAVRATRTQVVPWCDDLDRAITEVIHASSTWPADANPTADTTFDAALADLKRSVADLVKASRGEQVKMPEPPRVASEHDVVDPLAEHRDLLDKARPFSRVSHRPYDPALRERVAEATVQAAAIPPTFHFLGVGLDSTAHLANAVAGNASDVELLDLIDRDRRRIPICAAAALLQATSLRGDGQGASAVAARDELQRLWSETDWSDHNAWTGNDVNGQSMMYTFSRATSDDEVRDRLAQALEAEPELLGPLIISCSSWIERLDHQTWRVIGFERSYREIPQWLPTEAIGALATSVLGDYHGLTESDMLEALLQKALAD
jgi:hypothetical protein